MGNCGGTPSKEVQQPPRNAASSQATAVDVRQAAVARSQGSQRPPASAGPGAPGLSGLHAYSAAPSAAALLKEGVHTFTAYVLTDFEAE